MRCSNCGALNDRGESFCWACNTSLMPGMGGGNVTHGHVPNHLVWAILVTIFCCIPFGIVSIVYASQVNGKLSMGDFEGARDASEKAKIWAWVSFGTSLVVVPIWMLLTGVLPF